PPREQSQEGRAPAPGRLALPPIDTPRQSFWIITSVDLITAVTLSPFLRPISSALRLVITDSTTLSPTFTLMIAVTVPSSTSVISPFRWLRALSAMGILLLRL